MDRGTWWATVYGSHRVDALSDLAHMHAYIYTHTYTYHWGCYFFIRNSKLFIQKTLIVLFKYFCRFIKEELLKGYVYLIFFTFQTVGAVTTGDGTGGEG